MNETLKVLESRRSCRKFSSKQVEEEKLAKAKKNKHMTFYEAAKVARDANVNKLWLTHFSPSMTGHKKYMKAVCDIFPQAELGEDGKFLELDFAEE